MVETGLEDFQKQEVQNENEKESNCECTNEGEDLQPKTRLGDGLSFEDAEYLRIKLNKLETSEYEQDEKITSLQDEYNRQREEITWEIDQLIIPRKRDKEAMKEAGFTRQDDYEKHLRKNDLEEPIQEIENKIIPIAESLEKARKERIDKQLDIKDLKRKLRIREIYAPLMHNKVIVTSEHRVTAK